MVSFQLLAALSLGAAPPIGDAISDPNLACRQSCRMDGLTGLCHTSWCSTRLFAPGKTVACCKRGLKEAPCDGTVGCAAGNCCTAMKAQPMPFAPPPPPPLPPPPRPMTEEEAKALARAHDCDFAQLRFKLGKITERDQGTRVKGEYVSSAAQVWVTPWVPELTVVVLIRSRGEYVQVMEVDGAALQRYEQIGAYLRLTFKLEDEPARTCVEAACLSFDTVGRLTDPETLACSLPADLIDPPPSPPPRYISQGELWSAGQLSRPPMGPPPLPPLLSSAELPYGEGGAGGAGEKASRLINHGASAASFTGNAGAFSPGRSRENAPDMQGLNARSPEAALSNAGGSAGFSTLLSLLTLLLAALAGCWRVGRFATSAGAIEPQHWASSVVKAWLPEPTSPVAAQARDASICVAVGAATTAEAAKEHMSRLFLLVRESWGTGKHERVPMAEEDAPEMMITEDTWQLQDDDPNGQSDENDEHDECEGEDDKGEFVDGKCVAAEQSPIIRIGEGENYGMDRGEVEVEVATVVLSSDANGEDSAEREGEGERC